MLYSLDSGRPLLLVTVAVPYLQISVVIARYDADLLKAFAERYNVQGCVWVSGL